MYYVAAIQQNKTILVYRFHPPTLFLQLLGTRGRQISTPAVNVLV